MIWFTSDPHYGHRNIVKGVSKWNDKESCRDFQSVEDHDNTIVETINKYVQSDDVLYCLGDWSLGGAENCWNFRKRINCRNIYLTEGNHDLHISNNKLLEVNNIKFKIKSLFTSVDKIIHKTIGKYDFIMQHYAQRGWANSHKGSIMLYGHSHGNLPEYLDGLGNLRRTMDVGVDVAFRMFGEYRPFSYNEIIRIMDKRISSKI